MPQNGETAGPSLGILLHEVCTQTVPRCIEGAVLGSSVVAVAEGGRPVSDRVQEATALG